MNELFKIIDSLYDKYVKVWEDVCNIESPTSYKEGVNKVGAYFIDMAKELGFEYETHSGGDAGDAVCITMNGDVAKKPFVLSGHIDTVFPVGLFKVRNDGQKIYGPGVCDCKGGVVMSMMVMEALKLYGFKGRPVMLLIQTDEEVGSRLSKRETINYICSKAKDAIGFINMEGASPDVNYACLWRKGILCCTMEITGIAAHSSQCAIRGANAILEAAHKIIKLEALKDDKGLTCNCGVITGGTVRNTVAEKCSFSVDIRYANAEQFEKAKAFIEQVAAQSTVAGCKCEIKNLGHRVAMEKADRNFEFADKINSIITLYGFEPFDMQGRKGGSDAADVTAAGIPCVDNLGAKGGGIHSTNEYAYLSSLDTGVKKIATVIANI